jgi:hypothetical protein
MTGPEYYYAKERDGCWHAVTDQGPDGQWTAVCGLPGQPYTGQPSSITRLAGEPSPLHCHHRTVEVAS